MLQTVNVVSTSKITWTPFIDLSNNIVVNKTSHWQVVEPPGKNVFRKRVVAVALDATEK